MATGSKEIGKLRPRVRGTAERLRREALPSKERKTSCLLSVTGLSNLLSLSLTLTVGTRSESKYFRLNPICYCQTLPED